MRLLSRTARLLLTAVSVLDSNAGPEASTIPQHAQMPQSSRVYCSSPDLARLIAVETGGNGILIVPTARNCMVWIATLKARHLRAPSGITELCKLPSLVVTHALIAMKTKMLVSVPHQRTSMRTNVTVSVMQRVVETLVNNTELQQCPITHT